MAKRQMEDHHREAMVDAIRCYRDEPTQFAAPDRGQKQLSCYAVAAIRRKGVTKEQAASVMAVLIWLIKHANPTNGRCDPGIAKLALETGLAEKTVKRAIKIAEKIGYLDIETRPGRTSAYHLDFDLMQADFYEIEEQAKNPTRSCMTPPQVMADLPTQVNAVPLKHKEKSKGKAYPKRVHPPSAAGTTHPDENLSSLKNKPTSQQAERPKGFSGRATLTPDGLTYAEAHSNVSRACTSFDWEQLTEEIFDAAVAAEMETPGRGVAAVKAAAQEAWRARRKEVAQ